MTKKVETPVERKYGMPVGTGALIELSKFMVDLRDTACLGCKTGYKSVIPKIIGDRTYQIPVFCTCVPYITSEDKDGNLVVVNKGVRELWPSRKRPEQYIQNDLVRRNEFERAKQNLIKSRGQSKAHEGVTAGKYTLGVLSVAEKKELGTDLVKSLQPKFMKAGEKPANPVAEFVNHQVTRKVPMRNKEGHIIMVDDATAINMKAKGIAVPERPQEQAAVPKISKSVAKRVKAQKAVVKVAGEVVAKIDGVAMESVVSTGKRGRGRPAGSKNKPKTATE